MIAEKNIGKFPIGRVVGVLRPTWEKNTDKDRYGHVIGFGLNPHQEIVIKVAWADQTESFIHPANLTFL